MEEKLQTSFIPKAPIAVPKSVRSSVGLWFLLSLLVFILSILLAGGSFAYKNYLAGEVTSQSAQLASASSQFQPDTIKSLERLDKRIAASKTLLATHIAPTLLFDALSQVTLADVSFNSLHFAPLGASQYTVTLEGEARSYQALALESDAFSASGVFTAPAFSNVNIDSSGNVSFTLIAQVPASAIIYANVLTQTGTLPTGTGGATGGLATTTTTASTTP